MASSFVLTFEYTVSFPLYRIFELFALTGTFNLV